jgi:GNAT superfamily N-acetyltransferase
VIAVTVQRIDLDRARRAAKALLAAARAGDADALARLDGLGAGVRLSAAQLAVARELGAPSWPALVRRAEAQGVARADRIRRFVQAATDRRLDRAEALLAIEPALPRRALDAALVHGEPDVLDAALARDPGLATRPLGTRDWQPLLYVAHSAFLGGPRTDGLLACARALLAAGADPDAAWPHPEFGPQSALSGAAGIAHEPRLTALLLEAGANPDDGESLYHATYAPDHRCVELLLAAGATVPGTNAVAAALDGEDAELVDLLLRHAPGPGEPWPARWPERESWIAFAVWRERSPRVLQRLAAAGADLEWGADGLTPHRLAVRLGRDDLSAALRRLGARPEAEPADELLGAAARGDRARARALAAAHPEALASLRGEGRAALPKAAGDGRRAAVEALLELGVPVAARGELGGTALHHAAWIGRPDLVELLLARGADPRAEATEVGGTPLGWAVHGSLHAPRELREHAGHWVAVAERLVAAGAPLEPGMAEDAAGPLADWLAAHPDEAPAPPAPWGEQMWEADVAWLALLRAIPGTESEPVGDGFAVRTGAGANDLNGVVCTRAQGADPRAAIAWLRGAPAQWLCGPDADVHPALREAGARPERTAVAMGGPLAALDLRGSAEAEPVRDAPGLDAWLAVAVACGWWEDLREALRAIHLGLGLDPEARVQRAVAPGRGLVAWMALGPTVVVRDLAVAPEARRRGLGRALLAQAAAAVPGATALVLAPTPESVPFYERVGLVLAPYPRDRAYHLPAET